MQLPSLLIECMAEQKMQLEMFGEDRKIYRDCKFCAAEICGTEEEFNVRRTQMRAYIY